MGPAFCRMDKSSWRDRTFDRSSWDLRQRAKQQKSEAKQKLRLKIRQLTQEIRAANIHLYVPTATSIRGYG